MDALRGVGDAPDPAERDRLLHQAADRLGGEVRPYGTSVEGRPLLALRIPCATPNAPRVLCAANIHGVEYVGTRIALALTDALHTQGGAYAQLRQRAEIWVVASMNPDAYARTWERMGVGTMAELRTNAHGVDLNRNFPRPNQAPASLLPFTGSSTPGSATYRGPAALSEPETRALDALAAEQQFHAAISLHSFMGKIIPARVTDDAGYDAYASLVEAMVHAQRHHAYGRMASRIWDAYTGEMDDHLHHVHHTWTVTLETFPVVQVVRQALVATNLFWRMNPVDLQTYVANDLPAVVAYFHAALSLPRPPLVAAE